MCKCPHIDFSPHRFFYAASKECVSVCECIDGEENQTVKQPPNELQLHHWRLLHTHTLLFLFNLDFPKKVIY